MTLGNPKLGYRMLEFVHNKLLHAISHLPSMSFIPSQNEIRMVHEAAVSGNLEAIAHKEYRQSVYTARDTNGISAFHKVKCGASRTPVCLC